METGRAELTNYFRGVAERPEVGSCGERDIVVNWDVVGGVPFAHFANAVPG